MLKLSDATFLLGTALVIGAMVLAGLAVSRSSIPLLGSGVAALIGVAVLGMAGCAVGGISQAQPMGWTHPIIILGSVLGVAALVVLAAGIFGWSGVLEPVGRFVPGEAQVGGETVRIAIFALAGIIAVKWLVAVGSAAVAQLR